MSPNTPEIEERVERLSECRNHFKNQSLLQKSIAEKSRVNVEIDCKNQLCSVSVCVDWNKPYLCVLVQSIWKSIIEVTEHGDGGF